MCKFSSSSKLPIASLDALLAQPLTHLMVKIWDAL